MAGEKEGNKDVGCGKKAYDSLQDISKFVSMKLCCSFFVRVEYKKYRTQS
jgi:hypothetical protein